VRISKHPQRSADPAPKLARDGEALRPDGEPQAWLESAKNAIGVADDDLLQALLAQMAGGCPKKTLRATPKIAKARGRAHENLRP